MQASKIIVSLSDGKDSVGMLLDLVQAYGTQRLLAHYQVLPEDWPETLGYNHALCESLGVEFHAVQALYEPVRGPKGTEVRRLELRPIRTESDIVHCGTPGVIASIADLALRRGWPPSFGVRWCTSYWKANPLDSWISANRDLLGDDIVVALGERAAESPRRAKKPSEAQRVKPRKSWSVRNWLAVHGWSRRQTFRTLSDAGVKPHPAYAWQGLSVQRALDVDEEGGPRVGFRACIYNSPADLCHQAEIEANRRTFQKIADVEALTGRTWWMGRSVWEIPGIEGLVHLAMA